MKREHIHNPDDFESVEGKIRVVKESLDGLLDATERYRLTRNRSELDSGVVASLIVLHQVVEGILENEQRCT